jgi:hypothetical protein
MPYYYIYCFLCSGQGKINIGENYNKFDKAKNIQCPLCKGKKQLTVKYDHQQSWKKNRKDYL